LIESALFFALGFLVAGLIALMIMPSFWRRAVRLTRLRIEASTPLSLAEIKANRDQMRAEFARETRRLEMAAAELRRRAAERQIEAARARDQVAAIAGERDRIAAQLAAVEADLAARRDDFDNARAILDHSRHQGESQVHEVNDLKIRLADLIAEADARKVETAALRTTIQALEAKAGHLGDDRKQAIYRAEVAEAEIAKRDALIADERDRIKRIESALAERAKDLTAKSDRLTKAEARIAVLDAEAARLREALAAASAGPGDNLTRTMEGLERANADLESRLSALTADRDALADRLALLQTGPDGNGNAILRDRLADLAARIVDMTATAEGPDSAITRILADAPDRAPPAPTSPSPSASAPPAPPAKGGGKRKRRGLAERIRELKPNDPADAPPAA